MKVNDYKKWIEKEISTFKDLRNSKRFKIILDRLILQYIYRETRSAEFLKKYLNGYSGIIQTDGFSSYDTHFRDHSTIKHAGCMAHARREFEKFWKNGKDRIAGDVLNRIRILYAIEDEIRENKLYENSMFDEIVRIRQEKSKPILDNLYIFLQDCSIKFPESVGLAMAVLFLLDGFQELAGRKKRSTAVPICSRL